MVFFKEIHSSVVIPAIPDCSFISQKTFEVYCNNECVGTTSGQKDDILVIDFYDYGKRSFEASKLAMNLSISVDIEDFVKMGVEC